MSSEAFDSRAIIMHGLVKGGWIWKKNEEFFFLSIFFNRCFVMSFVLFGFLSLTKDGALYGRHGSLRFTVTRGLCISSQLSLPHPEACAKPVEKRHQREKCVYSFLTDTASIRR